MGMAMGNVCFFAWPQGLPHIRAERHEAKAKFSISQPITNDLNPTTMNSTQRRVLEEIHEGLYSLQGDLFYASKEENEFADDLDDILRGLEDVTTRLEEVLAASGQP